MYDSQICATYNESELLTFLRSLLREKYDELTYYLSKFWDDINEWKALRIAIAIKNNCDEVKIGYVIL